MNLNKFLICLGILTLSPFTINAQWMQQKFELKGGWNAIFLHVDASHERVLDTIGSSSSRIKRIFAWDPPSSLQYLDSPQEPLSNVPWRRWDINSPNDSELISLIGNRAYLVELNGNESDNHTLNIIGRPVPPRYQWRSTGLNLIGFSTPSNRGPNFSDYLKHAPELANNADIYSYNNGDINPVRLIRLGANTVNRGEAYWVRGNQNQYNNYYGPVKVTLQNTYGVHFGKNSSYYTINLSNETNEDVEVLIKSRTDTLDAPSGQPVHLNGRNPMPLLIRGDFDATKLDYTTSKLSSNGLVKVLKPKGKIGSKVEIGLVLDRSKMSSLSESYYAGILQLNSKIVSTGKNLMEINLPVTASVPSMDGLWFGEVSVDAVKQELTEYAEKEDNKSVVSSYDKSHLGDKRSATVAGWLRLGALPKQNSVAGILGEQKGDGSGSYIAVDSNGRIVFQADKNKEKAISSVPYISVNKWTHLGVTYNSSYLRDTKDIETISEKIDDPIAVASIKDDLPKLEIEKLEQSTWQYSTSGNVIMPPVIGSDGTIYFGSDDKYFYALNSDGTFKWKFQTNGAIRTQPLLHNGIVYFGSRDKYLYALRTTAGNDQSGVVYKPGDLIWKFEVKSFIDSSPILSIDKKKIYFGSHDNHLYSVCIEDFELNNQTYKQGAKYWEFMTNGVINSKPAVSINPLTQQEEILVGSHDNYLYSFKSDGILNWKYKTDGEIHSSPIVGTLDDGRGRQHPNTHGGVIYVGSRDNYLHAICFGTRALQSGTEGSYNVFNNGELMWKFDAGANVDSSPLIFTAYNSKFIPERGPYPTKALAFGSGNKIIFIGLNQVDPFKVPTIIQEINTEGEVNSTPAINDSKNRIFITSEDGFLYIVETAGLKTLMKLDSGGELSSPAIFYDNKFDNVNDVNELTAAAIIYFGSSDNNLKCFYSDNKSNNPSFPPGVGKPPGGSGPPINQTGSFYDFQTKLIVKTFDEYNLGMGDEVKFDGILNNDFKSPSQFTDNFVVDKVLDSKTFVVSLERAIPSIKTRNIYYTRKQREEWDIHNQEITTYTPADNAGQSTTYAKFRTHAGVDTDFQVGDSIIIIHDGQTGFNNYYKDRIFIIHSINATSNYSEIHFKVDTGTAGSGGRMDFALAPMKLVKTTSSHNYTSGDVVRLIDTGLNYLEGKRFRIDKIDGVTFGIAEIDINQKVPDKYGNGAAVQRIDGEINISVSTIDPNYSGKVQLIRGAEGDNAKFYNGTKFLSVISSEIISAFPDPNYMGSGYKKDEVVALLGGTGVTNPAKFRILAVDIRGRVKRVGLVQSGQYASPIQNSQNGVATDNEAGSNSNGSGLKLIPKWNQNLKFNINKLAGPHVGDLKIEKAGTWVKSIVEISPGKARAYTYPNSNTFGIGDRVTFSGLASKAYGNKSFIISAIQPTSHNANNDQYFDFEIDSGSGNSGPAHVEIFGGVNIYINGVHEETLPVDVLTLEAGGITAIGKTGKSSNLFFDVSNITASGSIATVKTVNNHPFSVGDIITISGVEKQNLLKTYNRNHTINSVSTNILDEFTILIPTSNNNQSTSGSNIKVNKALIEDFYGDLTDFNIYGKTLTPKEIESVYNGRNESSMNLLAGDRELWQTGIVGSRPKSVNRTFGAVPKPYKLKFIFHRDNNGNVKMLQRVFYGYNLDGKPILSTNEDALDKTKLIDSARFSVVHLPFKNTNEAWLCDGEIVENGTLSAFVDLEYDDNISNPFIHTYHPDHDNLDPRFENKSKIGEESWKISREIMLTFNPINKSSGLLSNYTRNNLIIGEYHEIIKLVGTENSSRGASSNEENEYQVKGTISLKKVSDIDNLIN